MAETEYTEIIRLREKQYVFRQGDPGDCMYEILKGSVGIYSGTGGGSSGQKLLTELGEGDFFGEMGMVRGFPRSSSAMALRPGTELRVIAWDTLARYFETQPSRIVQIMQHISNRLAELTDDYMDACRAIDALSRENRVLRNVLEREVKPSAVARDRLAALDGPDQYTDAGYQRHLERYQSFAASRSEKESNCV